MILKNLGVILAIITVLISYWLYEPLPDSVAEPWKLRTVIAGSKVLHAVCSGFEKTGYATYLNCTRQFSNAYIRNIQSNDKITVVDENFSGVKVRIYYPAGVREKDKTKLLPGILYFHPGGWTFGRMGVSHNLLERLTQETGAAFIDVDYRLAPEHIFPVPFDDCLTATVHILRNGGVYGIDSSRIAVSGESAGGNLATAVALRLASETTLPRIKSQILLSPLLQAFDLSLPSYTLQNLSINFMDRKWIASYWLLYGEGNTENLDSLLNSNHISPSLKSSDYAKSVSIDLLPEEFRNQPRVSINTTKYDEKFAIPFERLLLNPYFCPLFGRNLKNSPPVYMISCAFDTVRDENFLYVRKLKDAGVEVQHDHYEGAVHGLPTIEYFDISDTVIKKLSEYIQNSI
ncbi:arylacetamide deacetylase isoform X2 [Octopus sinensis]|uniref:Arylacetamide deacetylase isoform X2 n=1 Tax=Octopus sinensis TaxID=2607531 RepID=A0A6P7SQT0_9MOLL|nr:arylacetamide deacetylase isoform X2 [Octopus sinensis]